MLMSSSTLGRLVLTAANPLGGAPPLAHVHATHAMHPAHAPDSRLHSGWLVVGISAVPPSPAKSKAVGHGRS